MKVKIVSLTEKDKYGFSETTRVYVNDKQIGEGTYGGEPEDNLRCRDYSWVEDLFATLAKSLGAEVEIQNVEETE